MRSYSLIELMKLSRIELLALRRQILADLALLPLDSPERPSAFSTLQSISLVLARQENDRSAMMKF